MDPRTLVTEEIEAGAELVREFDKFMPVKASLWLHPTEKGCWLLYIISEAIDGGTLRDGYHDVGRLMDIQRSPYLDIFQVKLLSAEDPVAVAVWRLHERFYGRFPIRYGEMTFGRLSVDAAYLYPQLAPCP